ncbi:MAG: penicillin-binding protein 2 [Candidatus Magasanikbacteria bacterium]|nr:penicillin-binding protein 2 [Candidatus Magasanikbacteria bacterium]
MKKIKNKKPNIFASDFDNLSYKNLNGKYNKVWVEDSVVFENKTGKQVANPKSNSYVGSSFYGKKTILSFIFLLVIFIFLIANIFFLQIFRGDHYRNLAENNRQRIIPIPAERGLIFDRNGIQITKNIPNFSVTLVPQDLPKNQAGRELIIKKLAAITNQTEDSIRKTLEEYGSYSFESIIILEDVYYDTALKILIDSSDLPGIRIQRSSKRLYTNYNRRENTDSTSTPFSLSHILGYIGKLSQNELDELYIKGYLPSDSVGKTGVEKSYETDLRGTYGRRRIEVNAFGKEQNVLAEEVPIPGKHLYLTIDQEMQKKLEEILLSNLEAAGKKRGAGIVLDPQNGEILAMVSLPSFDNNDFSGGINQSAYSMYLENENNPLFNRSISGNYPSGSTVKMAMASAALQEGIINSATSFLSNGGLWVSSWFFPDWQAGGHGTTNVRKSLAQSVNTFYYYIGGGYDDFVGLGVNKIADYLRKFGFAQKLGIDIPGEKTGFIPSKDWKEETKNERWYIGDTYNLSIGQGDLLVTPLQIASLTSVIANKSTLYKPHLVKTKLDALTGEEESVESEIINKDFIHPTHLNTVKLGMKDCVDYGSCRRLSLLPFSSGGKTGTAQWSSVKDDHAWFTSFAPYDNPQVVVTILIEEGEGGSKTAAPVAYEFLRWLGSTCYLTGCAE